MTTRIVSLVALSTLLASAAMTQPAANNLTLQPESRLWVEGTSTVRGFSCKANTVNARVEANTGAVAATLAGEKAVRTVRVEVPSRSLDCENGTMNGHMFKAINADQHGSIVFNMTTYDITANGADAATVRLNGRLQLGGQERPISLTADAKPGANGTLRISGKTQLKLTDYGLRPPTLMMGTMKVGDVVTVNYDLLLRP